MQSIPTRIADAYLVRQSAERRADGSMVMVRSTAPDTVSGLRYEEFITAEFAFTSQPAFSRTELRQTYRCAEGEVYVCMVDVRLGSPTFGHWQGIYLNQGDARTLVVPTGVACGWQVLSTTASIEHRACQAPQQVARRWLRWNDRELAIQWPERPSFLAHQTRTSRSLKDIADQRLPRYHSRPRREDRVPPARASEQRQTKKPAKDAARAADSLVTKSTSKLQAAAKPPKELILVIGSSGQLGRDLCLQLRQLGTVVGACRKPDRGSLLPVPVFVDVSRPASLRQAIRQVRPTLIVNATGLTDIDQAEAEPRLAQLVNATAPAIIADEAQRIGAGLVHFCTSMVFGGGGERPWRESDAADPRNQYARTKWIGTEAVRSSGVAHLILRSGWLYSTHGDNYIRRLIDSLTYRSCVSLASDHLGSPTSTDWLASVTAQLLSRGKGDLMNWLAERGGLYHAATLGYASKLEVGDQVVATCRQHALPIVMQKLQGRSLDDLPTTANIPANSRLDASLLAMTFGLELPRWQQQLNQHIAMMLDAHAMSDRSIA